MFEHLDRDARRRVLALGAEEARRRGDARIGTEHLLLALLHQPDGALAETLGVGRDEVREALDRLDRQALAAIGIDTTDLPLATPVSGRRRPPFTSGAREALRHALLATRSEGARRVTSRHLMLGLLERVRPDPVAHLLADLGIDADAVRDRLTRPAA